MSCSGKVVLMMSDSEKIKKYIIQNGKDVFCTVYSVIRTHSAESVAVKAFAEMCGENLFPDDAACFSYRIAHDVYADMSTDEEHHNNSFLSEEAGNAVSPDDVNDALAALPVETGEIVCLCDMFGYGKDRVSAITGLSPDAVEARLDKGRKSLKSVLMRKWGLRTSGAENLSKTCSEMSEYINDIIDGAASDETRDMFFEHTFSCEKCRKEYDISLMLHDAVTEVAPVPSENFVENSFAAAETFSVEKRPLTRKKNLRAIVFAIIAVLMISGTVVGVAVSGNIERNTDSGIVNKSDEDIINEFIVSLTNDKNKRKNSWTVSEFLSTAGIQDDDYDYVAFFELTNDTPLGVSSFVEYIPGSIKNNGVALYTSSLSVSELFSICSDHIINACALKAEEGSKGIVLVKNWN